MFKLIEKFFSPEKTLDVFGVYELKSLSDCEFIEILKDRVLNLDVASRVMLIVAYENIFPHFEAAMRIADKHRGNKRLPRNLSSYITFLHGAANEKTENEKAAGRRMWFYFSSLLLWGSVRATENTDCRKILAIIWEELIVASKNLKKALEYNELWDRKDLGWFDHIKTEKDAMEHVLLHVMPTCFLDEKNIVELMEREGIHKPFLYELKLSLWNSFLRTYSDTLD